jgi:hypothetical protein
MPLFERALEIDDHNASAWLNLANTEVLLGQYDKCLSTHFRQTITA